jgi:lysophospholipase L1-like esterase
LPDVQFVIGEPFFLKEGSAIVAESWIPEFYRYQKAAKMIAREFGAAFIPYQSIFDEALNEVPATYWAEDGVHPTLAGCHLMAQAWLETVKRL